jgi:zinc-binding alcohol dehydrogenase family protein
MKAVGFIKSLPSDQADSLLDIEVPTPVAGGRDLLVAVKAISVNPVDTKVRRSGDTADGKPKILGWDAAGIVTAAGPDCHLFKAGDAVYYAGDLSRPGTNAEFHLVDERIVGAKPATLDFLQAAALPLTTITAWEALFDRLAMTIGKPADQGALLIIGGAGGVGSIAIQLARRLTGATVVATASRPETRDWCLGLGAHAVIDHSRPFGPQLKDLGINFVPAIFSTTATDQHLAEIAAVIAPQGRLCLIDDPLSLDLRLLKRKAVSVHWEFMFTRALFGTPDMIAQHRLLNEVSALVDEGLIKTTLGEKLDPISAAALRHAHGLLEGGRTRGKLVMPGYS